MNRRKVYRAIDLFAGIGGIRLGFTQAFGSKIKFVYSNDNNKYACKTYQANFNKIDCADIFEKIKDIPEHDILMAGFPCQPFSLAGAQKGFEDKTRGTLFFAIAKIIKEKKPQAFFLENVKNFRDHNQGKTWLTVKDVLEKDLGYTVYHTILNAKYFGVPQNRPRFYAVGFRKKNTAFEWPKEDGKLVKLSSILEHDVTDEAYYLGQQYLNTLKKHRAKHEALGHGFGYKILDPEKDIANTIVVGGMGRERNLIKNSPLPNCWKIWDDPLKKKNCEGVRVLTPREFARLQGFPDSFKIPVSRTQANKQFANSVAVPVITAIAKNLCVSLESETLQKTV